MFFDFVSQMVRQRAALVADPYDPDSVVKDWSTPVEITVEGYFSSGSSAIQPEAVREHLSSVTQLVFDDPDVDVAVGDRIKFGPHLFTVTGIPARDVNPFTGWQPTLVVDLEAGAG